MLPTPTSFGNFVGENDLPFLMLLNIGDGLEIFVHVTVLGARCSDNEMLHI